MKHYEVEDATVGGLNRRSLGCKLRSHHARIRQAQRGIGTLAVELVCHFGSKRYTGDGGIKCLMDRRAMKKAVAELGQTANVERLRDYCVVLSAADPTVVLTVYRSDR